MKRATEQNNLNVPLHIITGQYPPASGGLADYTQRLAFGVSESGGDAIVWCCNASVSETPAGKSLRVCRPAASFGFCGILKLNRALAKFDRPRRLLVQWTPQLYGWRSMNVLFCLWVLVRGRVYRDEVEVMVHELFLPLVGSLKQRVAAIVQRLMVLMMLQGVSSVCTSTSAWTPGIKRYLVGRPINVTTLPIPSNIELVQDSDEVNRRRSTFQGQQIIGHFGTCGDLIAEHLEPIIQSGLAEFPDAVFLLFGRNSDRWASQLSLGDQASRKRIVGLGELPEREISLWLQACDVMVLPYPDGVTTRRGTTMASLQHGCCVITNDGPLTEGFWREQDALVLVEKPDSVQYVNTLRTLLSDTDSRARLCKQARRFYGKNFSLKHTTERYV
ncbi:glycosyltransferase family protein [Blastopirellula retiformator]|uniref:Glycosyl transferases group 1 n=1 Tax=Blastopirellula retiformator TaxID=2527970 RepID=A0A5C5V9C7_9BACT|nr:glycosyltransferase [Blastopirellula retiformator]TWT34630.1 hypothetical protein Enr8_20430 [Blastopirellula retiformator]